MTELITRLRRLLNSDPLFADDEELQQLLDDHALRVDAPLVPDEPFYRAHQCPYQWFEAGATVYWGGGTVLTEGTDYLIDLQRGIVTTQQPSYLALRIRGVCYDLNAAAADGWEQIAGRESPKFDFKSSTKSFTRSQAYDHAVSQAARYRSKAWAIDHAVERSDTLPGDEISRIREHFRRSDV